MGCVCGKPADKNFMICCDICDIWFHGKCVGVAPKSHPQSYVCPRCSNVSSFLIKKVTAENKRMFEDFNKSLSVEIEDTMKKALQDQTMDVTHIKIHLLEEQLKSAEKTHKDLQQAMSSFKYAKDSQINKLLEDMETMKSIYERNMKCLEEQLVASESIPKHIREEMNCLEQRTDGQMNKLIEDKETMKSIYERNMKCLEEQLVASESIQKHLREEMNCLERRTDGQINKLIKDKTTLASFYEEKMKSLQEQLVAHKCPKELEPGLKRDLQTAKPPKREGSPTCNPLTQVKRRPGLSLSNQRTASQPSKKTFNDDFD